MSGVLSFAALADSRRRAIGRASGASLRGLRAFRRRGRHELAALCVDVMWPMGMRQVFRHLYGQLGDRPACSFRKRFCRVDRFLLGHRTSALEYGDRMHVGNLTGCRIVQDHHVNVGNFRHAPTVGIDQVVHLDSPPQETWSQKKKLTTYDPYAFETRVPNTALTRPGCAKTRTASRLSISGKFNGRVTPSESRKLPLMNPRSTCDLSSNSKKSPSVTCANVGVGGSS